MQGFADNLLDCVKNPYVEGNVTYLGLYETGLEMGIALEIAGSGYGTPWSATPLPVVEAQLDYQTGPGSATSWVTTLKCSNRMGHYNADAYLRPDRTGLTFDWSGDVGPLGFAGAASAVTIGDTVGAMRPPEAPLPQTLADMGIPTSLEELGIPTDVRQYMPTAEDFAAFGIDLKGRGGA